MFVKDLTDSTWEISRYSDQKTLVIEREHRRHQEQEEKRHGLHARYRAERAASEAESPEQAQQVGAATTQVERMLELERVVDSTISDIDHMAAVDEFSYAEALESGIKYFEQLDRLLSVSIARRNDVLEQIELYRQGLGNHLRRVSDEMIDAEFSETTHEAPSIAGPDDGAQ